MILVDSSVWVMVEHGRVDLRQLVGGEQVIATCPMVFHEVLRGARGAKRYMAARAMLLNATMLDSPTPLERFEYAAQLYKMCREEGVTPSSSDCLIAACAIANRVPLLHQDDDFNFMADVTPLRIFTRS